MGSERDAPEVVVIGHIGRDVALLVEGVPEGGAAGPVRRRLEAMGGKGANQAVALARLGVRPGLVASLGDDAVGAWVIGQAAEDGIDVSGVAARAGGTTTLIVSLVDGSGEWRYLEDITPASFISDDDARRAGPSIRSAKVLSLQLQQTWEPLVTAAGAANEAGTMVVVDGAPPPGTDARPLLELADVWRCDRHEAELLAGRPVGGRDDALTAARDLLGRGPRCAAVAAADADVVVWPEGEVVLPHATDRPVVDTTGAGDAFVAGLIAGLLRSGDPAAAGQLAADIAGQVVGHLGGRPEIRPPATEALRPGA